MYLIFSLHWQGDLFEHKSQWQHYYGLNGSPEFLSTAAQFLSERVGRGVTVSPSNLRLVNGVSTGLEVLSFILADPGQVILTPVPTYARFFADMNERMKTEVVGVHLEGKLRDMSQIVTCHVSKCHMLHAISMSPPSDLMP